MCVRFFALAVVASLTTLPLVWGDVIDQQFIGPVCCEASVQPLGFGPSYGQTFTAGISGRLVGADLALDAVSIGRTPNDVLVEVVTTVGGFPTSNVLDSGMIAGAGIPVHTTSSVEFSHVNFSSGIGITAGEQLALLFFGEGLLANAPNIFLSGPGALYAGGQAVIFAFGSWLPAGEIFFGSVGSVDFAFRTFVDPVPEPASLILLGTGLGILARFRGKFLS
jgi:hypothetical protein